MEVALAESAQLLVLREHQRGLADLLRRRREVVVPEEGQLLAERALHRDHPTQPPRRECGRLRGQLLVVRSLLFLGGGLADGCHRFEVGCGGGAGAEICIGVAGQDLTEVGRASGGHRGVDLGTGGAKTGATQQSGGADPFIILSHVSTTFGPAQSSVGAVDARRTQLLVVVKALRRP